MPEIFDLRKKLACFVLGARGGPERENLFSMRGRFPFKSGADLSYSLIMKRTTLTAGTVETQYVLAAAYRGRAAMLTNCLSHLCYAGTERAVCSARLNMSGYSEDPQERPTCPKCAARWEPIIGAPFRAKASAWFARGGK